LALQRGTISCTRPDRKAQAAAGRCTPMRYVTVPMPHVRTQGGVAWAAPHLHGCVVCAVVLRGGRGRGRGRVRARLACSRPGRSCCLSARPAWPRYGPRGVAPAPCPSDHPGPQPYSPPARQEASMERQSEARGGSRDQCNGPSPHCRPQVPTTHRPSEDDLCFSLTGPPGPPRLHHLQSGGSTGRYRCWGGGRDSSGAGCCSPGPPTRPSTP
jgi:hypothetical protein